MELAQRLPTFSTAMFGLVHGWWQRPPFAGLSRLERGLLTQVWSQGWAVLDGFFDAATCGAMCAEWDRVAADQPHAIQRSADGADHRLFGVERAAPLIADRFTHRPELQRLSDAYSGASAPPLATLGARLEYQAGNRGSGQGWHRDSFFRQYKAIAYLSDVGPEHGPFQYVSGSHRMAAAVGDTRRAGLGYRQNRLSDDDVARVLAPDPARLVTFTAKAGTVILADTRGIHRGMPIAAGVRYALTNYYYPATRHTDPQLRAHFAPYVAR